MQEVHQEIFEQYQNWIHRESQPSSDEFIENTFLTLSEKIKKFNFLCTIEGIKLQGQNSIQLGSTLITKRDVSIIRKIDFCKNPSLEAAYNQFCSESNEYW